MQARIRESFASIQLEISLQQTAYNCKSESVKSYLKIVAQRCWNRPNKNLFFLPATPQERKSRRKFYWFSLYLARSTVFIRGTIEQSLGARSAQANKLKLIFDSVLRSVNCEGKSFQRFAWLKKLSDLYWFAQQAGLAVEYKTSKKGERKLIERWVDFWKFANILEQRM